MLGAGSGAGGNVASQLWVSKKGWNEIDVGSAIISGVSGVPAARAGLQATKLMVAGRKATLHPGPSLPYSGPAYYRYKVPHKWQDDVIPAVVSGITAGGIDVAAQWAWATKPSFAAEGQPSK